MASLGLAGRIAEAQKAYQAYREFAPATRMLNIRERTATRLEQDIAKLEAGLRLAGME
jgi:hypothetical protein